MRTRLYPWIAPTLATLGLADSAYLAVLHWRGEIPPCHGYAGCALVNTSPYSEIFGFPVAALGTLLYVALLGVAVARLQLQGPLWGQATLLLYGLSLSGAAFLAYLTGVELFVLGAYCYWCLGLTAITFLLLGISAREVWGYGARGPAMARA